VRGVILTIFLGAAGLAAGVFFFGQIDGENISWDRQTLSEISWDDTGQLMRSQPPTVWACLWAGLVLGAFTVIMTGGRSRKSAVQTPAREHGQSHHPGGMNHTQPLTAEQVVNGQRIDTFSSTDDSACETAPAPADSDKKRWFVVVILLMVAMAIAVAFIPLAAKGLDRLHENRDFSWTSRTMLGVYITAAASLLFVLLSLLRYHFKKKSNPKRLAYWICFILLGLIAFWTFAAIHIMKSSDVFSWTDPEAIALYFAAGIFSFGIIVFISLMRRATTRWEMEQRLRDNKDINDWLVIFNWTRKILHLPTIVFSFLAAFIMLLYPADDFPTVAKIVGACWFCIWLFCHIIEETNISLSVAIAIFAGTILLAVLALFGKVLDDMARIVSLICLKASPALYVLFGLTYLSSIVLSYMRGLFYYIALEPNQMIVQFKIGEDGETFQRMQYDARIEATVDIFEWFFFQTATIKIQFRDGKRSPMEFYVGRIRKKAEWLSAVLGVTAIDRSKRPGGQS